MSKREGRKLLAEAKRSGKKWASEYLDSEDFQDSLAEQLRCGEVPVEDLPETKKQARRIARDIIADFWNDAQRQYTSQDILSFARGGVAGAYNYGSPAWFQQEYGYDRGELISAWWDGAHDVLFRASVRSWLGDEVKFRADECRQRE